MHGPFDNCCSKLVYGRARRSTQAQRYRNGYGARLFFQNPSSHYTAQAARFSSAPASAVEEVTKDGDIESPEDHAKPPPFGATEPVSKDKHAEAKASNASGKDDEILKLRKEIESVKWMLREKDSLVKEREKSINELKNKLVQNYAETENIRERARREAENTKKFSIQSFAKDLLDVADNLERAAAAVPDNKNSSELIKDAAAVGKQLQTLLEGVKMTENQLLKTFKKFGIEKFNPIDELFDPNAHLAVCEVDEPTKDAGSVAVVFKAGYILHERVIRPAEVAVAKGQPDAIATKEQAEPDLRTVNAAPKAEATATKGPDSKTGNATSKSKATAAEGQTEADTKTGNATKKGEGQ